ncbi:MAG: cytochrome-c peroxidase [Steroidobacteraceae bacterium]
MAARCAAILVITGLAGAMAGANTASGEGYHWKLPPGFPPPAVPARNPMSEAKVELGQRLFFDPRLSVTHRHACASCHIPALGYTDGRLRSEGATGGTLLRQSMTLLNVGYAVSLGWTPPARPPWPGDHCPLHCSPTLAPRGGSRCPPCATWCAPHHTCTMAASRT